MQEIKPKPNFLSPNQSKKIQTNTKRSKIRSLVYERPDLAKSEPESMVGVPVCRSTRTRIRDRNGNWDLKERGFTRSSEADGEDDRTVVMG